MHAQAKESLAFLLDNSTRTCCNKVAAVTESSPCWRNCVRCRFAGTPAVIALCACSSLCIDPRSTGRSSLANLNFGPPKRWPSPLAHSHPDRMQFSPLQELIPGSKPRRSAHILASYSHQVLAPSFEAVRDAQPHWCIAWCWHSVAM